MPSRSSSSPPQPLLRPLLLLALAAAAVAQDETIAVSTWRGEDGRPRPASDLLGDVWGEDNGVDRKRWLAEMHRAAPGVDWRALERENAEAERARRLAGARAPGCWEEVGSSNQAGHTRCVALGSRHLYVGAANGGLWRGTTEGADWTPISEALFGGVDEVVALPAPGGDRLLLRRGSDLFHSADGGATWVHPEGLTGLSCLLRSVTLPTTPPRALLLGLDGEGRAVLLASGPDGARFTRLWTGGAPADADLWVARTGERAGREVWLALDGQLLRSLDGGVTFTEGPRLEVDVDAVHLAASEAGPPRLYLAARDAEGWHLHRGEPEGALHEVGALDDFWGVLTAFPGDEDVLLLGGLEAHRSTDGGETFQRLNAWGQYYGDPARRLHADVRGLSTLPDPARPGEDLCWISTDGGTYLSTDRGETVRNLCLDGLGIAQVYSTLTAPGDPDLILAGTQDQGYQRGRRRAPEGAGPSTPFDQLLSGDYGYLTSSSGGHELVYSSYPGFVLVQEGADDPDLLYPWVDLPQAAEHAWMPPIVAHPTDPERFFLLADRLYRYRRKQGPYWAYRPYGRQLFTAGGGAYLTALAFAPAAPRRAYAANDVGRVWTSNDGGETWSSGETEGAEHLRPTCLAVDPVRADRAVLGGAGYSSAGVLVTEDGGRRWRPLGHGLPATLVHDLAWAGRDLYAATAAGAWRLADGATGWESVMGDQAPATSYWSVEWVEGARLARFGTYGRGIWDFYPSEPEGR